MSPQSSERLRWLVSALVLVLVALFVLVFWQTSQADDNAAVLIERTSLPAARPSAVSVTPTPTPVQIAVDVIGAVQQAGVYYLPEPVRVAHAIEAAGGLAPHADRERINLAALVTDGQQLRVPEVGDAIETVAAAGTTPSHIDPEGRINVNTADTTTLERLPGIGPATAQAIISYREANGPFQTIDDLENVPRIGPVTIDKFRDQVTVGP